MRCSASAPTPRTTYSTAGSDDGPGRTRRRDRVAKRGWYRRYGVREYWLIDPIQASVTVVELAVPRSRRRVYKGQRLLQSAVLPNLHTAAAAFFE